MSQNPQVRTGSSPRIKQLALAVALCSGISASFSMDAQAGAIIYNSSDPFFQTVALGVNDQGHLNFLEGNITTNASATGLALRFGDAVTPDFRDATAPGCLCEGWGVSATVGGSSVSGSANVDDGVSGLGVGTFGSTLTSATSVVSLLAANISVTHRYGVSLDRNTFQGNVTITNNTGSAISDLVYRRAMDWDVPPTEFNELVTHSGVVASLVANGGNLRYASDNGFASSDPLVDAGFINGDTVNTDFADNGPTDHGSVFDFAFGTLANGQSRTFNIFYGAYNTEADALAAVATLSPNLYSLGQPGPAGSGGGEGGGGCEGPDCPPPGLLVAAATTGFGSDGSPTFLFAFGGVGGVEPGLDADNPILPFVPSPGQFFFDEPTPRRWYDPPFSDFEYTLEGSDPSLGGFLSVEVDDIPGKLDVVVGGLVLATLDDFGSFAFDPLADIRSFILRSTVTFESTDPALATALPVLLDWEGKASRLGIVARLPIVPPTGVPAPATVVLMLVALGALKLARRRS